MAKLSDTALVLLNTAATRHDRLVEPPNHLPAAARNAAREAAMMADDMADEMDQVLNLPGSLPF